MIKNYYRESLKNSFRQPCGLPRNMPLACFSSEREATPPPPTESNVPLARYGQSVGLTDEVLRLDD